MNDHERYLFDLQGFITVPDALGKDELAGINAIFDAHIARDIGADKNAMRWGNLFSWGAPLRRLVANPRITPILEEIIGRNFRLDHDYIDLIRSGKGPIGTTLHGGGTPFDPSQYYHWHNGRMHNGLTVVAYNLRDVNPGDGGFGCVPGSHKSNLPFPNEWRNLEHMQQFMRAVTGPAGTAIIFTEALTHGTLPWHGKGERRTLFMKYSPHPVSWSAKYYDASQYDDWSESERGILEAPNARYNGR